MVLLIRVYGDAEVYGDATLHSNMVLLIPGVVVHCVLQCTFTFQYGSINTQEHWQATYRL